jgi:hypothetical protein
MEICNLRIEICYLLIEIFNLRIESVPGPNLEEGSTGSHLRRQRIARFWRENRLRHWNHRYLSKPSWGTKQNVWGKNLRYIRCL